MNFASLRAKLRNLNWRQPACDSRVELGRRGERVAAKYLKQLGLRVLVRNFRCPAGEVDLICRDRGVLAFVEVKSFTEHEPVDLNNAVRSRQWSRISRAARWFTRRKRVDYLPCRFDLVIVVWKQGQALHIEHFPYAYQPRF